MLISDPDTDKAAASMDVRVGMVPVLYICCYWESMVFLEQCFSQTPTNFSR